MSKSKRLGLILLASGTKTRKSWNQGKKLINSVFLGLILSTSEPKPESHQIWTPVLILSISGATARESYNPHGSNGKLHKIIYMRRQHKIKSGFVGLISSSSVLKARNAKQERECSLLRRGRVMGCLLYTSPSPRDKRQSRMPSSA